MARPRSRPASWPSAWWAPGSRSAPLAGLGFALAIITIVLGFFLPPLQREVQHRPPKPRRETAAYRWSRIIQRRPWPFAIGATAFLLVLAIPFLNLRLGFSDESNFADDTTTKQAYDLIVEGFGEGFNAPCTWWPRSTAPSRPALSRP